MVWDVFGSSMYAYCTRIQSNLLLSSSSSFLFCAELAVASAVSLFLSSLYSAIRFQVTRQSTKGLLEARLFQLTVTQLHHKTTWRTNIHLTSKGQFKHRSEVSTPTTQAHWNEPSLSVGVNGPSDKVRL